MLWCPILPDRRPKFEMIMRPLAAGWRSGGTCVYGFPPDDDNPVAIYGQIWGSEQLLRRATLKRRPYYHIDNGYWRAGRGRPDGYYRFCFNGMSPAFLHDADPSRARALGVEMKPWRKHGRHILLGLPGEEYGCGIGMSMIDWISKIRHELPLLTDRPILIRERKSQIPLEHDFKNCWAVVTHSSNIAVDAVTAGIPVFVASTSSALPVGNYDLAMLEAPMMPDREQWMNSLACQQFRPDEMASGITYDYLQWMRTRTTELAG